MSELYGNAFLNGEIVKKMGKQEEILALDRQTESEQQEEEVFDDSFENRTIQIHDSNYGRFRKKIIFSYFFFNYLFLLFEKKIDKINMILQVLFEKCAKNSSDKKHTKPIDNDATTINISNILNENNFETMNKKSDSDELHKCDYDDDNNGVLDEADDADEAYVDQNHTNEINTCSNALTNPNSFVICSDLIDYLNHNIADNNNVNRIFVCTHIS